MLYNTNMKILFELAMDYEIENIFNLNEWKIKSEKPFKVYIHKRDKTLGILKTGIGKVNAAAATQYALSKLSPKKIVNLGTVGCVNKKIKIGEIRQISECTFFDVDVTAFGYSLGQIPECEVTTYALYKNSKNVTQKAKTASGDAFITNMKQLDKIIEAFYPDFIDMEIGAIAHTLYINDKLQLLESYKAPSDYADKSSTKDFYENEKIAFKNLKKFANKLLTS